MVSASLDYYRALRDAASEAAFFLIYGNLFAMRADAQPARAQAAAPADPRELPFVKEALAAVDEGGYAEAVARVAYLLARKGEPLQLAQLQLKQELMREYRDLLPVVAPDEARRIRGEQEIVVRYAPERALATLPLLLAGRGDRERLLNLIERTLSDPRIEAAPPSAAQRAQIERIRGVLGVRAMKARRRRKVAK